MGGSLFEVRVETPAPEGAHDRGREWPGGGTRPSTSCPRLAFRLQIERHACFLANSKEGALQKRLFHCRFIEGLNDYQSTKLPPHQGDQHCTLWSREDGTLVDGDVAWIRKTGLFRPHRPPELATQGVAPQTTPNQRGRLKRPMRFLCDEWLVDVATDLKGKFTSVLLVSDLEVQRALLDDASCHSSSLQGSQRGGQDDACADVFDCRVWASTQCVRRELVRQGRREAARLSFSFLRAKEFALFCGTTSGAAQRSPARTSKGRSLKIV